MKKLIVIALAAVMVLALIGGAVMAKTADGDLQEDALVYAWQSHSDHVAGAIILASGRIGPKKQDWGLGLVDTELSMAYTWDFYGFNKNALLYAVTKPLVDTKDYTTHVGPFDATATLKITDGEGDLLWLDIVHGVVHEGRAVYWYDGDYYYEAPGDWVTEDGKGTENEWLIGLEVNGGESTGKFEDKTGTGLIRLVVISNNYPTILKSAKYIAAYDIYLKLGEVLVLD